MMMMREYTLNTITTALNLVGMQYNLYLESAEDIIPHVTHMVHMDDPEISFFPTEPNNFR